jgi:hypothetical protein
MKEQFIIRKTFTAYLVTVVGREVIVEHLDDRKGHTISKTISDTLQTVGNTRLVLSNPPDPVNFLKSFYNSRGWDIEEVR